MSGRLKSTSPNLGTPQQPYEVRGEELWFLPLTANAVGTRWGYIIAELDAGYLFVFAKNQVGAVSFMPKEKVRS